MIGSMPPLQDIWRLSRYRAGGPLDDVDQLIDERAKAIAKAMMAANGKGRAEAFDQTLGRQIDGDAIREAIFAADPEGVEPTEQKESSDKPSRLVVHPAASALDEQDEIRWVIKDLVSSGSVSVWAGAPGSKKTWTLMDGAVSIAMGTPWLGRQVKTGPVLIVDEESGPRRMRQRLARVMRGHNSDRTLRVSFTSLAGLNLRDKADVAHLDSVVTNIRPVAIIVDALADVMPGGDENSVRDVQLLFLNLRQLAERHQVAVIVIHHLAKAGGYRGSSAIAGAVDLLLNVVSESDSSIIEFTSEKARDTEPVSFTAMAKFDEVEDSFRLVPKETTAKTKHRSRSQEYVIRYLKVNGASLLTDITSHADTCSSGSARTAVYALAKEGIIRRCDEGGSGSKATYTLIGKGS